MKKGVISQDAAYLVLECAVAAGQLGAVTRLMDKGLSAKTLVNGHTVLYTAVEKGHSEIVKFLIGRGGDPNEINNGVNLLVYVARRIRNDSENHYKTAVVLIENGADLYYRNEKGVSLLIELLHNGDDQIRNAIVRSKRGAHLKAVWIAAAYTGNLSVLKEMHPRLLQNMPTPLEGEQVVDAVVCGWTALGAAIVMKQTAVIEFLLAHGANLEHVDEEGKTYLACAIESKRNSVPVIKLLVSKGANIFAPMKGYDNIVSGMMTSGNIDLLETLRLSPQVKESPDLQEQLELCIAVTLGQVGLLDKFKFEAKPAIEAGGADSELKELELQPIPPAVIVARQEKETPFAQLAEGFQEGVQLVPTDGNHLKAKVE